MQPHKYSYGVVLIYKQHCTKYKTITLLHKIRELKMKSKSTLFLCKQAIHTIYSKINKALIIITVIYQNDYIKNLLLEKYTDIFSNEL